MLAEHRGLVRAAIADQAGHEVGTQGDAFFAAFAGAKQAVLCAVEIQRALAAHDWPDGAPVRVRIGVHTGHAVPADTPTLYRQLKKLPWTGVPSMSAVSTDHGRRARTIKVALVPTWIEFDGATQVAQLRRTVTRRGRRPWRSCT